MKIQSPWNSLGALMLNFKNQHYKSSIQMNNLWFPYFWIGLIERKIGVMVCMKIQPLETLKTSKHQQLITIF
jgi:hypothetical protein